VSKDHVIHLSVNKSTKTMKQRSGNKSQDIFGRGHGVPWCSWIQSSSLLSVFSSSFFSSSSSSIFLCSPFFLNSSSFSLSCWRIFSNSSSFSFSASKALTFSSSLSFFSFSFLALSFSLASLRRFSLCRLRPQHEPRRTKGCNIPRPSHVFPSLPSPSAAYLSFPVRREPSPPHH